MAKKYTAKGLRLLDESIEVWEKKLLVRNPLKIQLSLSACPLCRVYYGKIHCGACPIKAHVGESHCLNTPFHEAEVAYWGWSDNLSTRRLWLKAARAEIKFLKDVRQVAATALGIK
jgi:hypothetical protein